MPSLNKQLFVPYKLPPNIVDDTPVFYISLTNEVFLNYEEFFTRQIQLQSLIWSCAYTGKNGLTFEEALESERNAQESLEAIPDHFGTPILFLVHCLSHRGRLDDLVNDIYTFVKDRYFVGEIVTYGSGVRSKKMARILSVAFIGENFTLSPHTQTDTEMLQSNNRSEVLIGQPLEYRYTVQMINNDNIEWECDVREEVTFEDLSRSKSIWCRSKLKLFLKMSCQATLSKLIVKPNLVEEKGLEELSWIDVFGGPIAIFPRTPMMQRGPPKGYRRTVPLTTVNEAENGTIEKPIEKKRGKTKNISCSQTLDEHFKSCNESLEKASKKIGEKKRKKIEQQQEELRYLFESAERYAVKNLTKWEQKEKLLKPNDVNELKEAIRNARIEMKENDRLRRQKEKELFNEWRKPRDDLLCEDHKMLPEFESLPLPRWLSCDEFGSLLNVYHFFWSFSKLLPIKEVRSSMKLSFADIVAAVKVRNSQIFVDLLEILLRARSECANEEDGDEANLNKKDEIVMDANCDLDHKVYGERIRKATILHENIRNIHGLSARHLPIDRLNITEVLRLNLISSGYYTGQATHRFKLYNRGGLRCYEDAGFLFVHSNSKIMEILEKGTVFDLSPNERLALFETFMHQLCSYNKFRSHCDECISNVLDLRKELRNLRIFDSAQEREAKDAKLLREYEAVQQKEADKIQKKKSENSVKITTLTNYLRIYREGSKRRDDKIHEFQKVLMEGVPYSDLETIDIEEIRRIQKEFIVEKERDILLNIFKAQEQLGWNHLGYDRAYRSYWFIDSLSLLLVESPSSLDEIGTCSKATPLEKVPEELHSSFKSEDELREKLLVCSNHSDCVVHRLSNGNRWSIISSFGHFEMLKNACNSRGMREGNLAENLTFFESSIVLLLDRYANDICQEGLHDILFSAGEDDSQIETVEKHIKQEFVELLLDFEEKVEQGGVGHLAIKDSGKNRTKWRQCVLEGKSVASFVDGDLEIFNEKIFSLEELSELIEVEQLALAFLQVVQGISLNFLRAPFAAADSKENTSNRATTTFDRWQKSLLKVSSISALSLFYTTIDCGILWRKSLLQAKCRACRRRAPAEKLILCVRCDVCYHYDCIRPRLQKVVSDWICFNCVSIQKANEAEQRRMKQKIDPSSDEEDISDELSSSSDSSLSYKASGNRNRRRVFVKGIATRSDKQASESTKSKRKRKSETESQSDSSTNNTDTRKKKRKTVQLEMAHSKRCLRESNRQSRDKLRALESVIAEALRHPDAWPFVEPVDGKSVPDYYQVIKRPMDLRTMMNKLKQKLYDTPEQVVRDSKLVFSNCRMYNDESSEIYKCANKLEVFLDQKFDELLSEKMAGGRTRSKRR